MGIEIRTNNQPRDLLSWAELSQAERDWFLPLADLATWEDMEFFRYRGTVFAMGDITHADESVFGKSWHGYHGDSFSSGIVVRLVERGERVIVGRYWVEC